MNYNCYWISANGAKNWEGTFRTVEETDHSIKLRRMQSNGHSIHPTVLDIELPKEGHTIESDFVKYPQYWTSSIQVNLGDHPYSFIFEPFAKRYVIEIVDTQKQTWLEEFLDDNKIDYIC